MGRIICGCVLVAVGFGLTFFELAFTTWLGLAFMVAGAFLFFWGWAKTRPKKKG